MPIGAARSTRDDSRDGRTRTSETFWAIATFTIPVAIAISVAIGSAVAAAKWTTTEASEVGVCTLTAAALAVGLFTTPSRRIRSVAVAFGVAAVLIPLSYLTGGYG